MIRNGFHATAFDADTKLRAGGFKIVGMFKLRLINRHIAVSVTVAVLTL